VKTWRNWVLLASSLAFSLILGEIFVRVFLGDTIGLFPRYHAEAAYGDFRIRRLRPATTFWHTSADGSWQFVVNKQGFRSERDFSYSKTDGVLRVIMLGDSHTQGYEARQDRTYAAIIERYLNERGLKIEVINTGVSGFSTAEAAVLLEYEALKYDPDVVILGFFANDMEDNTKSSLFRLKNGELVVRRTTHIPVSRY
jgi:GDSL-like Lipase/Acylhydrolase family